MHICKWACSRYWTIQGVLINKKDKAHTLLARNAHNTRHCKVQGSAETKKTLHAITGIENYKTLHNTRDGTMQRIAQYSEMCISRIAPVLCEVLAILTGFIWATSSWINVVDFQRSWGRRHSCWNIEYNIHTYQKWNGVAMAHLTQLYCCGAYTNFPFLYRFFSLAAGGVLCMMEYCIVKEHLSFSPCCTEQIVQYAIF